jgi:hypothetical protein
MRRKKIYFHIGTPKSGSTTIQRGLFMNTDNLRDAGWLFPKEGRAKISHRNLFFDVTSLPGRNDRYKPSFGGMNELLDAIRAAREQQVIISCEDFSLLPADDITKLKRQLGRFNVQVIVYLRRQDQAILSGWAQVARGMTYQDTFEAFSDNQLAMMADEEIRKKHYCHDYWGLLKKWRAVFGKRHLTVRVLERGQLTKPQLFHDFLAACDIPNVERFKIPPDSNVTPSLKIVEVLRQLGIRLQSASLTLKTQLRISELVTKYGIQNGWDDQKLNLVDRELHEKIMSYYEEGNRKVAREYFNRQELFLEPFQDKPLSSFDLSELPAEEAISMMAYVLSHMLSEGEGDE